VFFTAEVLPTENPFLVCFLVVNVSGHKHLCDIGGHGLRFPMGCNSFTLAFTQAKLDTIVTFSVEKIMSLSPNFLIKPFYI
jgi:hypothetical protein